MAGERARPILAVAPPPSSRPTSKAWYVVAGGLLVIACSLALTGIAQFRSTIEDMRRVAMPGKAEIVLPVGPSTLYVEHRTLVEGRAIEAPPVVEPRCTVTDPDGRPVPLQPTAARVSYAFDGFAGAGVFDLSVEAAGTYSLACEAPTPFGVAVGYGVGTWIVVSLISGFVPGLAGVIFFFIVWTKRRRQLRRMAAAGATPAP
jgi:hypothetical protein